MCRKGSGKGQTSLMLNLLYIDKNAASNRSDTQVILHTCNEPPPERTQMLHASCISTTLRRSVQATRIKRQQLKVS